jgi:excisionase family DNA binding protein
MSDIVPTLYTVEEVAEILGCKVKWLGDQLRAQRFSGVKIGGHWKMTGADVAAAIESCRPGPKPERDDPIVAGLSPIARRRIERNRGAQ